MDNELLGGELPSPGALFFEEVENYGGWAPLDEPLRCALVQVRRVDVVVRKLPPHSVGPASGEDRDLTLSEAGVRCLQILGSHWLRRFLVQAEVRDVPGQVVQGGIARRFSIRKTVHRRIDVRARMDTCMYRTDLPEAGAAVEALQLQRHIGGRGAKGRRRDFDTEIYQRIARHLIIIRIC